MGRVNVVPRTSRRTTPRFGKSMNDTNTGWPAPTALLRTPMTTVRQELAEAKSRNRRPLEIAGRLLAAAIGVSKREDHTEIGCLPGSRQDPTPGAGLFGRDPDGALQLTAGDARTRSDWIVPGGFRPGEGCKGLTYHRDKARWSTRGTQTWLRAVARGQEFVLDAADAESTAWAARLWTASRTAAS